MTATILEPGQIEPPAGEIPFLRLPALSSVFSDRAQRFRQLAAGHKMGDFLEFMGLIADAQQAALNHFPQVALPGALQIELARKHGMPILAPLNWTRDEAWRNVLFEISESVASSAPIPARDAIARLSDMGPENLELLANAILSGEPYEMDLGATSFVAAALQTYWTHMSTALGSIAFGRTDMPYLCPVCASPPVASIVRIGGQEHGLRFLHCSLCATEWHMVRSKCSNCESTKNIAYYGIEGDKGIVKAEACEECSSYLKILYMEKDPLLEPTADDLASLMLDIKMDEMGMQRSGPNLFLIPA